MYEMIAALVAARPDPVTDHLPAAEDAFYESFSTRPPGQDGLRSSRWFRRSLQRMHAVFGTLRRNAASRGISATEVPLGLSCPREPCSAKGSGIVAE
ncbi:hypothetical protein [Rhizobium halophytocola]|uniref:Uncharacterized protein n=1 Tax=Rhizobium halophytocola TaxID=735519 RepID=A0ABS4E5F3_9HYPH|nr:hypothetical protein [Rhizobium halophytocola]MBP1853184.1 hypothetical protein [Rhizobium halophytocola]